MPPSEKYIETRKLHPFFELIKKVARLAIWKNKITGLENIDNSAEAVFVCNHAGSYGPIIMGLCFPYKNKPWVDYRTMEKEFCRDQIENNFVKADLKLKRPLSKWLAAAIVPACLALMRSSMAIPVYNIPNKVFRTFNQTSAALQEGYNIIVFPESTELYTEFINNFHTGFVYIGREYFKRTGKVLRFYPVYVNPKDKIITIGKSTTYIPMFGFHIERDRISDYLKETINNMAVSQRKIH
jgi:1-acyl-sn-glycerol-3-phosphate acyltransferase